MAIMTDVAPGRRRKGSDLIFLSVEDRKDLRRLSEVEPYMQRNGVVWVVYPKGRKDLRQVDVIGRASEWDWWTTRWCASPTRIRPCVSSSPGLGDAPMPEPRRR